jgi:hypothetical protein
MLESQLAVILHSFRQSPEAKSPENPFATRSTLAPPARHEEILTAWSDCPEELAAFWQLCREARLFEDREHGQWGLALLDPPTSARRTRSEVVGRPGDFRSSDCVIGTFLGDQELLVLAPSEYGVRRILVALPLDGRSEWSGAGDSLVSFLGAYFDAVGHKFWEPHR